jgi:hypothetical protein
MNYVLQSRMYLKVSTDPPFFFIYLVSVIFIDWLLISLETRSVTEPAGSLALAGLKSYILQNNLVGAQKRLIAVISGANMNFDRLRFVAERAQLGEGTEVLFSVELPEGPGRFAYSLFFMSPKRQCFLMPTFFSQFRYP